MKNLLIGMMVFNVVAIGWGIVLVVDNALHGRWGLAILDIGVIVLNIFTIRLNLGTMDRINHP